MQPGTFRNQSQVVRREADDLCRAFGRNFVWTGIVDMTGNRTSHNPIASNDRIGWPLIERSALFAQLSSEAFEIVIHPDAFHMSNSFRNELASILVRNVGWSNFRFHELMQL